MLHPQYVFERVFVFISTAVYSQVKLPIPPLNLKFSLRQSEIDEYQR